MQITPNDFSMVCLMVDGFAIVAAITLVVVILAKITNLIIEINKLVRRHPNDLTFVGKTWYRVFKA